MWCNGDNRHIITLSSFTELYKGIQHKEMGGGKRVVASDGAFMGWEKHFSDKLATTIKSTSWVVSPVHLMLLNCPELSIQCLVGNPNSVVGLLPVTRGEGWSQRSLKSREKSF